MGLLAGLLAGFAVGAFVMRAPTAGRSSRISAPLLGGILGLIGAGVMLAFFGRCAFVDDAETTEGVLAVYLAGAVGWIAASAGRAVLSRGSDGPETARPGEVSSGAYRLGWYWPWLLLSPTLVILVFFLYWPAIQTFRLSTKLSRLGAPRQADRCLANFSELLVPNPVLVAILPLLAAGVMAGLAMLSARSDPRSSLHQWSRSLQPFGLLVLLGALWVIFESENGGYRQIYVNTLIVSAGTVIFSMACGLGLAYLTFGQIKGITAYRTLLIWPYAISPPVSGLLFFMLFNATGGVVAAINSRWGIDLPDYTANASLARATVILASVWKLLGYNLLFFLAGLQTVPRDQIEAAALDGASGWQRFRHIVVPALGPISFFLLITNLTYSFFDVYGTIDFLTKGAPAGATSVAIYEIIRVGVDNGDLGRGAAQSVVLFLAVIGLTAWQFNQAEGRVNYGGA